MNDQSFQRSELVSSQKPKEKLSPSKKTNLSDFYRRNDNLNLKRKQLYQSGEEQKFEEENKNINYVNSVRYYRPTPFAAPKKSNSLWDEEGNLIQENIQPNKSIKNDDNSNISQRKVKAELTKTEFNDFLKRNQGQVNNVKKQEHQRVIPQNKNNFNSFLRRQEESVKNRNKEHPLPRQKSYINKKSSELAIKAMKKTQSKNDPVEIEYSFHPDMSKTINYQVTKLPVELAETQLVLKNIEIESLKMKLDDEKKKDPTKSLQKKHSKKCLKKNENRPSTENLENNNEQEKSPNKEEN